MQREKNTKTLDDFLVISVFFIGKGLQKCSGWMDGISEEGFCSEKDGSESWKNELLQ